MNISKVKKECIKEVLNHESIKFANSAVTLQALRSGTGGYTGEMLDVVLEKVFNKLLLTQRKDIIKKIEEMKEDIDYHYCEVDETGYYWGWYHALDDIVNQIKK